MPAIRLTEFRSALGAALARIEDADQCAQALSDLMAHYGTPLYRSGQRVLPAYHLPPAAFNLIWQSLRQAVLKRPAVALPLAQALWQDPHLEARRLAARLLGLAPPDEAAHALFWAWLAETQAPGLQQALLTQGTRRLVQETPEVFFVQAAQRLQHPGPERLGALRALTALVASPTFENAPALYGALQRALLHLTREERPEAAQLLQALAQRWPQETSPFLWRVWNEGAARETAPLLAWVIRRVIPRLPPEIRKQWQQRPGWTI